MATALLGANGKAITGSDGYLIPHAYTFQALFNSFSRQYSYRYDEALRNSPANALAMKRDAYYIGLLQERTAPTINLPWSLETDDDDDAAQAYVRSQLTKIIKKTPRLIGLKQAAMEALWYGRAGAQIEMRQPCYGEPFQVSKWSPVNGDKIQFGHDGVPSILVNSTTASEYEGIRAGCTTNHDRGGKLLKLVEQSWRDRFLIHQHDIVDADYYDAVAGGSIGGVGVRHLVYWSGWMRTEALTWMLAFMESVGMADLLIFNYLSSDASAKQAAIANASQITGKLALVVPRGANETYPAVESTQVNSQGVQFLRDLIEGYFDRHIERVIVGQTLSAGTEGSGLGGTGVADFHKDTKYQLIKTDVEKLDETLTTDLVRVLLKLNFPWAKFDVRWKSSLPDPEAKDKLESGLRLVSAGVPLKAVELRKLAGFTAPEEGDEVVGGQQQPGMDGGMGQGALPPGGDGDPMAALGGGATTPGQDDPMAGMGGVGADDVLDPELQDALMAAIMQAMEEGDSATVQALCDMAGDPGTLQAILAGEQPPEDSYASDEELWLYSWQGAQTKGGKVKAVGVGEHAGRTLYGARAEAALRGKQPRGPSKEAQRKAGVQERKQARQASAQAAMEIATKAMNGQATPDDFAELPNHLPLLNSTQIRNIRRRLGIKLGGLRRRDEMAQQLIDHAKQQIEGGRATTQQPEATPEKPATPVDKEYQDASIPPVEQPPATPAPGGDDMATQAPAASGRATTSDTKKLAEDVYGAFKDVPAQGRFGDNKVFISHLWEHMRKTNAAYKDVSLDEFKQQLLAGHRSNDLDLSRADLVQAMERQSVEGSLINSGNAEYHFVTLKNKPYKPLPAVPRPARDPITGRVIRPEQPPASGRETTPEAPAAAEKAVADFVETPAKTWKEAKHDVGGARSKEVGKKVLSDPKFREDLAKAWNTLIQFPEYQHQLVDMPTLYHQMTDSDTNKGHFTYDEFRSAMWELNQGRKAQLHVLNETHTQPEAHNQGSIAHNDRLYHFARFNGLDNKGRLNPDALKHPESTGDASLRPVTEKPKPAPKPAATPATSQPGKPVAESKPVTPAAAPQPVAKEQPKPVASPAPKPAKPVSNRPTSPQAIEAGNTKLFSQAKHDLGGERSEAVAKHVLSDSQFRKNLTDSWNHLLKFPEFKHGLVDMPSLYTELQARDPNLTKDEFRSAMWKLSKDRKVQLHVLNEVHAAPNAHNDGSIATNDRLYHYARFNTTNPDELFQDSRATTQAEGETRKKSGVDAVTLVNKIKSLSMDSTSEDINAATSGLEDMSREDLSDLVKDLGIYHDTNSNNLRDLRNRISNKVQSGQYVVRPVSPPPAPKPQPQPVSKPAENQSDALKSGGSELPKLRGTEKQAKWGEDVRNYATRHMVHSNNPKLQEAGRVIASMTQAKQLIDVEQEGSTKLYLVGDAVKHGRELAEWIKANRGMDSEKTAKALFDKKITPGQAAIAFSLLDPDGEYDGFHETALPMFNKWLSKQKSLPRDTDRHNDFPPPEEDKPTEKRATKYPSVETSRGNRLVHGIRLDANKVAKFLELQKQGKIPDNVTAKKTNGKWDISLWGDSDEEIDAARREMASMGIGYAPTT